jgi:hypothetical protein
MRQHYIHRTAHVTQTWLVDEDGDFIEAKSDAMK